MIWRRMSLAVVTIATLVLAMGGISAQAQAPNWPQRPVRIIAPYAAGGNSDVITRLTAQRLTEAF
jgi:tripartite-type tricarboxylate transporter receptor subunit TctC